MFGTITIEQGQAEATHEARQALEKRKKHHEVLLALHEKREEDRRHGNSELVWRHGHAQTMVWHPGVKELAKRNILRLVMLDWELCQRPGPELIEAVRRTERVLNAIDLNDAKRSRRFLEMRRRHAAARSAANLRLCALIGATNVPPPRGPWWYGLAMHVKHVLILEGEGHTRVAPPAGNH